MPNSGEWAARRWFILVLGAMFAAGGSICPFAASPAAAQDNYEIQVYGSETVKPRTTMFELHSNYTFDGTRNKVGRLLPTNNAFHETLEITHGFTPTFETGFYVFTSARHGYGWRWVGSHIRPRWRAPEEWKLPVGLSLSLEVGYQQPSFSEDTWTVEIRPIIDKQLGRWYLSFNPVLDRSLAGANAGRGFGFSPNFKVSYDVTPKITIGLEYYGAVGPAVHFDPVRDQQHQLFPSIDLNLGPEWEFNFGVGFGLTPATDGLIVKTIVGRRFSF